MMGEAHSLRAHLYKTIVGTQRSAPPCKHGRRKEGKRGVIALRANGAASACRGHPVRPAIEKGPQPRGIEVAGGGRNGQARVMKKRNEGTRRTEPISLIANGQKCECSYETIHDAMRIEAMQVATLVSERVTWQQILSFANDCPHENDIYLQIYNQCNPLPSRPKEGEDEPRDDELGNDLLAASDSPLT